MSVTRVLERLEHLGDSEADRALRPPVTEPRLAGDRPPGEPRDRRPRRRRWGRPVLVTLAAVVVAGLVVTWLVAFSPVLGARHITVDGVQSLSAAQVQDAAAIPSGEPLLRLDSAAVVRRVEALPDVAAATVTVSYPATVTITVTERAPVLYVGAPTRLVDRTGLAYRAVDSPPAGVPLARVADGGLTAAAAVAASLPARALALVAYVDVNAAGVASLQLADGRTVAWGDSSRLAEKAELLTTLLAPSDGSAPQVPGTTIDLTDPDVVTTR